MPWATSKRTRLDVGVLTHFLFSGQAVAPEPFYMVVVEWWCSEILTILVRGGVSLIL